MDNWDEVRTAYQVARLGTVSGAAEVLGVHRATVADDWALARAWLSRQLSADAP